jgi:hypothetical protein
MRAVRADITCAGGLPPTPNATSQTRVRFVALGLVEASRKSPRVDTEDHRRQTCCAPSTKAQASATAIDELAVRERHRGHPPRPSVGTGVAGLAPSQG